MSPSHMNDLTNRAQIYYFHTILTHIYQLSSQLHTIYLHDCMNGRYLSSHEQRDCMHIQSLYTVDANGVMQNSVVYTF